MPARPGRRTTHARTLHLACVLLGGVSQLATRLAVPEAAVRGWIEGSEPQAIFLAAVDLILLDGRCAIVPATELSNHPGVADSVEIRALRKAIELAGGRMAFAARLGLKARELERWLSGKDAIPREALLRVVDVLLDELAPPVDGDGDGGDPPAPRFSAPPARRDCD